MKKRKVTAMIGGQACSFYSDDSDDYISELEQRANAVMKETAGFSGSSAYTNAVLSVVSLTDALMRTEKEKTESTEEPAEVRPIRKNTVKIQAEDNGQISVWELLEDEKRPPVTQR